MSKPLPTRQAKATRKDQVILDAAREVFLADPKAPITAVAQRAGVGISALYRRYASKEDLLRTLCHEGLRRFLAEAEAAASEPDGWEAFTGFLRRIVDADVHSLTVHLAGTFTPTPQMHDDMARTEPLVRKLFARAKSSGRLRHDAVVDDITLVLEGCAAVRVPDSVRTKQLRRRYLAILLSGLSAGAVELPGPAPKSHELNWRWTSGQAE
ncbi:TetR/AcrR family transcriptional regulator [Catelliglobosispora koreensis]|uniref:TetR/AcrR family transcriptional regulator n=1 Tax=Catelliglobosispora koreensis TaxID=129052 RepID=UPI000369D7DA|nr:TetR/AcrR family transcriptional regulator [Catelliglobosispora koreensis]